jgi:hypothetical protein
MDNDSLPGVAPRFRAFGTFAAFVAIAVGTVGLAGAVFHAPLLRTFVPGQIAIKVNTCICFLLVALSLLLQTRPPRGRISKGAEHLARASAVVAMIVGLASLSELLLGWELHIDQLLFTEQLNEAVGSVRPGLMSSVAATAFMFLGSALFLLWAKSRRAAWLVQLFSLAS